MVVTIRKIVDFKQWESSREDADEARELSELDQYIESEMSIARPLAAINAKRKTTVNTERVCTFNAAVEILAKFAVETNAIILPDIDESASSLAGIDMEGHVLRFNSTDRLLQAISTVDDIEIYSLTNGGVRMEIGFRNIRTYVDDKQPERLNYQVFEKQRMRTATHEHNTWKILCPLLQDTTQATQQKVASACKLMDDLLNDKLDCHQAADFHAEIDWQCLRMQMDAGFGFRLKWSDGTLGTFLSVLKLVDNMICESVNEDTTRVTLEVLL